MSKSNWAIRAYSFFLLWATMAVALPAQTFTTLHSFDFTDGSGPLAGLAQGSDGNLYGTTATGGAGDAGTAFKITLGGTLMTLHGFDFTDGGAPVGLVQATSGDFYGTTSVGGGNSEGTVFKITPSGTLTTLYTFCSQGGGSCTDGSIPEAGLVQGANGNFYGTTSEGGANAGGTIFEINPSGMLMTLYSFCSQGGAECTDGKAPQAALVQATNGKFYGTTTGGGANGGGTIFTMTSNGMFTSIYSFCSLTNCADGSAPDAALVQASNGNLYGTTNAGGGIADTSDGTVFEITPGGTLTTLHSFDGFDGASPFASLVQAADGNLYGTTYVGGITNSTCSEGCGTIFKITTSGTLTTLYSFCSQNNCTDGRQPLEGLVQDTNGNFYGTTEFGGTSDACSGGCGAIFGLSAGLGPFVETLPTSSKVGADVRILGTSLTGATSVNFNGTAAVFTVVSSSLITTTVPVGATSGTVHVQTARGGKVRSNVAFRVQP
jgi:uncharacterized repeat protein (TIGR03803 family)